MAGAGASQKRSNRFYQEIIMDDLLKKRFLELAERSYRSDKFIFTDFLSMAEVSLLYSLEREIGPANMTLSGGIEDAERCVARFGNPDSFGYSEDFPIVCIKVEPLMQKFSDDLSHRDILGSIMGLGIERSNLGDIIISENKAYVFCLERMADYVIDNLTKVRHTSVKCSVTEDVPKVADNGVEMNVQAHGERIDGLVSKIYGHSRSKSIELFRQQKIFVNGRICENNSYNLKEGDLVSVRGSGRFKFLGVVGTTRKGNLNVKVVRY